MVRTSSTRALLWVSQCRITFLHTFSAGSHRVFPGTDPGSLGSSWSRDDDVTKNARDVEFMSVLTKPLSKVERRHTGLHPVGYKVRMSRVLTALTSSDKLRPPAAQRTPNRRHLPPSATCSVVFCRVEGKGRVSRVCTCRVQVRAGA